MRPLHLDFWGLWPRQVLAGLAILLAAAVLSLMLFPVGQGSFVSTHGPATAFRSHRVFLAIRLRLAALFRIVAGLFLVSRPRLKIWNRERRRLPFLDALTIPPLSPVLLC